MCGPGSALKTYFLRHYDVCYPVQAQEVCEGGELGRMVERASWSRRGKRLYAFKDAARWSEQAAKALHYLHSAQPQVLHRDVKTSNLLLTEPGRHGNIRLCDFGLTKLRSALLAHNPRAPQSLMSAAYVVRCRDACHGRSDL